jgi:hypothetical protein
MWIISVVVEQLKAQPGGGYNMGSANGNFWASSFQTECENQSARKIFESY